MKSAMTKSPYVSSGFTLIELMVTIAVLAIIVSIAAPNISTQLANSRVKSTTSTLENALKEARAESLIRRQTIGVEVDDSDYKIEAEEDNNNTPIVSYGYSDKSIISAVDGDGTAVTNMTFKPSKTADERTFTICDANTAANARQVIVSAIGRIESQVGGTC